MKKLLVYLKGYEKECIIGPAFKLLEACFELFVPLVIASIVDVGIKNNDIGYIYKMCAILISLALVGLVCSITAQYFAAKAAVGFSSKLRHSLMEKIQSFSYKDIDTLGTSTMITRMTSDVNQVQNGLNLILRLLLRSPFVVIGSAVMAFTINFSVAMIFVIIIPILSLLVFGIMSITMPMHKKVQENLDGVTKISRENLNGMRVLRAFCREHDEIETFNNQTNKLHKMQIYVGRISALMNPLTFIAINTAVIALIWTGALKVDGGILTQGQVIALYNYMGQILVELIKTADFIVATAKAGACATRVVSILNIEPAQKNGTKNISSNTSVEFKNVGLRYYEGSDEAISNISFKANKGETIGVLGGTGAGKTSLVNLIPKFYDCTSGEVLINGENIKELNEIELREQIAVVPQKSVAFKGTVRSNLLWGKSDANDDEVYVALEKAQAKEFVDDKEGLDTTVEQGGKNFSGGQKQRLAIARALVRNPAILILDDSASALDYATDAKLRKSIKELENNPITFIISQRASSVKYADLILVLEDGQLVGKGNHEDLIDTCNEYSKIYYSQFPKEASDE